MTENRRRIVGELKGKYTQVSAHWVWCQFRAVNGRPDQEGVWRVCRYSGADEC